MVAEPTGLSRTPLGRKNSPYSTLIGIVPIEVRRQVAINPNIGSTVTPSASGPSQLTKESCPDGGLLLDYVSNIEGVRIQMCGIRVDGKFIKHGPEIKFNNEGQPASRTIYNNGLKL